MAKTEKTVNYTPEQTAELVTAYQAAPTAETVSAFAEKLGKTTRSIVAKLSREGVYKKKEYVGKTGEKPVKKDALADKLAVRDYERDDRRMCLECKHLQRSGACWVASQGHLKYASTKHAPVRDILFRCDAFTFQTP